MFACALALVACGGGGDDASAPPAPSTYTVGGTLSGLAGSGLVLQNNGGGNLNVSANGAFTFPALASGSAYSVTVLTQPSSPTQTCTVASGSGNVGSANVTNVTVSCATNTYTVGGTVSGMHQFSSGLVLQNNAADDLRISANGNFTFAAPVASAASYAVTVKTQSDIGPAQNCVVANGSGTVTNAAVGNVTVTCTTQVAKFLYTANSGNNSVSAYSINPATGALTAVPGSPFAAGVAPLFMAANRAGTALYVANQGSGSSGSPGTPPTISAYSINAGTGVLTQVAGSAFDLSHPPPAAIESPVSRPLIHPSGAFGYLAIRGQARLYGATVDSTTGSLTEIPGLPNAGIGQSFGGFDPAGSMLYIPHDNLNGGANGAVSAYRVTAPAGTLTPLGEFATGGRVPAAINLNAAGTFLLSANSASGTVAVFEVDAASGALNAVANSPFSTGPGTFPTSVALHRNRNFVYVTNLSTDPSLSSIAAFQVDWSTGVLTAVPGSPFLTGGHSASVATIEPTGRFVYVTNTGNNTIQGFVINQTNGVLTAIGTPVPTEAGPAPLVVDPSGRYLYSVNTVAGTVSSYAINQNSGTLSLVNTVAAGSTPRFPELVGLQ